MSAFQGPDDTPSWEMCIFRLGMGSCFYPMTCNLNDTKHLASHVEIAHVHAPPFCVNCVSVVG